MADNAQNECGNIISTSDVSECNVTNEQRTSLNNEVLIDTVSSEEPGKEKSVSSSPEADTNNNKNDEKLLFLLRKAIDRLDDKEVDDILRKGLDVQHNFLDDRHLHTALHYLVLTYTSYEQNRKPPQANVKLVDILSRILHYGVDINQRDVSKKTALHFVSSKPGNSDIIKVLLSSGADVNSIDRLSQTALHLAVTSASQYDVRALLDGGADPNAQDISSHSPLHIACKRRHNSAIIELLLKYGAKANLHGSGFGNAGQTPLHIACRNGHVDNVSSLLKSGARVDIIDGSGQTCLHMAAAHDITGQVIPKLVEHHVDVNKQDDLFEDTPLHKAVKQQMFENIQALIKARANPNIPDCHKDNVLHIAATCLKDIHAWTLLMRTGASITSKNKDNFTPLEKATRARNTVAVNVMHQFSVVSSPRLAPSPRLHRHNFNHAFGF